MQIGELELSSKPALKALSELEGGFSSTFGSLSKIAGIAGAAAASFAAFSAVSGGLKETLDLGGTLQDLSTQTGQSVSDLVVLRQAFQNAGLGADSCGSFLLKLQDSIAGVNEDGKSTANALQALGLSAAGLRNMSSVDQIEALQQGFGRLADQTEKVAVARDLFGKSGGQALSLLGDPEALGQAQQQAGALGQLMEQNVGAFDRLGDVVGALKLNMNEFFGGVLEKIAPEATTIADALGSIDFTGIGEAVGALTNVFLGLGEALTLLAPLLNTIGGGLHSAFGNVATGGSDGPGKRAGGGFGGLFNSPSPDQGGAVTSLQRVGLGGGFGAGGDALISESRVHTSILREIARNTGGGGSGQVTPPPV